MRATANRTFACFRIATWHHNWTKIAWTFIGSAATASVATALADNTAVDEGLLVAGPPGYHFPVDKLRCVWHGASRSTTAAPSMIASSTAGQTDTRKCCAQSGMVLVACGSFNPPTVMHMKMFELAASELERRGYQVCGAYMSPVNDAYGKAGLASGSHRAAMCTAAAASSPIVMVDDWEVRQQGYTRSLQVLRHFRQELRQLIGEQQQQQQQQEGQQEEQPQQKRQPDQQQQASEPRIMLLCGADVLASMAVPGVWRNPDILLEEFGVVCLAREGTDLAQLLGGDATGQQAADEAAAPCNAPLQQEAVQQTSGHAGEARNRLQMGPHGSSTSSSSSSSKEAAHNLLYRFRDHIHLIEVQGQDLPEGGSALSSSIVRSELQAGRSVAGLVPPGVEEYVRQHGLYGT